MASWTDGPEYAPLERPAAFETPPGAPLEPAPAVVNLAEGQPLQQPSFDAPPATIPLANLVPNAAPTRNPTEAFAVLSSSMTSAWGSAHSTTGDGTGQPVWNPQQPLVTSSTLAAATLATVPAGQSTAMSVPPNFPPPQTPPTFPQHGTPDWFSPPPTWQASQHPPRPVTVAQMWAAATPGVMIPLLVGLVVGPLSIIMLSLAFALASRVTQRRSHARRAFAVAAGVLVLVASMSLLNPDTDLASMWGLVSGWAQLCCGILTVVIMLIVGAGIRAGERPERQI